MAAKEILTGIQYYQYHFIAALTFLGYSLYHFFFGNILICVTTGLAALSIVALIGSRMYGKDSQIFQECILVCIIAAVFSACYSLGIRGVAWLFPLIIGIFFNYSNRTSLLISSVSVLIGLWLSMPLVGTELVVRMMVPLTFTIGFAYLYRASLEKEQSALEKEANEDYLTGIFNRRSFNNWLQRMLQQSQPEEPLVAVFYVDIDDFKQINDTYGHRIGDQILHTVGQRLTQTIRQTDAICSINQQQTARIAGDEFVLATANLKTPHSSSQIAERIQAHVNEPFELEGKQFKLNASIGVAIEEGRKTSAEALLRQADAAMHRSKESGKNCITYFDESIARDINEKQRIARGIDSAIEKGEFFLNFMPIFRVSQGKAPVIVGAEVLIRCVSDELSGIGPDVYIPIAEEYGSIKAIDLYVIDRSFEKLSSIQAQLAPGFILAINISAKELHNEKFPAQVEELARKHGIPCALVELEITETSLIQHDQKSLDMLNDLKQRGFKLSLDDFGTGYTAFSQLHHYPVDTLKIDRSFVWNIKESNQDQQLMIDVILSLARIYEVDIIAEGVETENQLDYLLESDCQFFQGYYFSKPLDWDRFQALLAAER